jgi:hypothetical protein
MDISTLYLLIAVILALVLPLVPHMVQFRIGVLQRLGLKWIAEWHEKESRQIVIAVRFMMLAIIGILLWKALL